MPDQKISQMDPATALTGAELVPAVQSGGNVQTTTQDIANLVSDVAQSWTANQIFGGSTADVASFYRSGAAAKTRWIESTNNNYHGIRNNANTLTFDYNGTDYLTFSSSGAATFSYAAIVDRGSAGESLLYVGGANNQRTSIALRSNAGYSRGIGFYTGASSLRWFIECESTAESGGNAGSNFVISAWTDASTYSSTPFYIARSSGVVSLLGVAMGGPINMKSYTVAGLPAGSAGDVVYASNGRKNGEGAGVGTGVLVFKDGTAWCACDTGATVAA